VTFEDELLAYGFTPDKVTIYTQKKSFIDKAIFCDWFANTFLRELELRRERFGYYGPAFLIMDNCTAHEGDDFRAQCAAARVEIIFLPPHSSNQLQMLDLCVFGATKALIARTNTLEQCNVQTDHIVKILDGFEAAARTSVITASFRNAGISLVLEDKDRMNLCQITPQTARCVAEKSALEHGLQEFAEEHEGEDDDEPDIEEYRRRVAGFLLADDPE
jgi:hypothetical protein